MTADVKIDDDHFKFDKIDQKKTLTSMSPLRIRYSECENPVIDHIHLAQDSMFHECNEYCLGEVDVNGKKLRTCQFGYGTELTSNKGDTPGKEFCLTATIEKIKKELSICCYHG